ncbi:MAG: phycobilisome protein [Actinomycetota bacterium]
MLSQLARLSVEADGRYATAEELQFLKEYFQSCNRRLSAYQKIKVAEQEIINQVEAQMQSLDPSLFRRGATDLTSKWRLDTVRVLRYSAATLLIDDSERLRDRFLLWFQTILGAFQAKTSAKVTYQVMQGVIKQYLTPEEAFLLIPILETNSMILGK